MLVALFEDGVLFHLHLSTRSSSCLMLCSVSRLAAPTSMLLSSRSAILLVDVGVLFEGGKMWFKSAKCELVGRAFQDLQESSRTWPVRKVKADTNDNMRVRSPPTGSWHGHMRKCKLAYKHGHRTSYGHTSNKGEGRTASSRSSKNIKSAHRCLLSSCLKCQRI